MALKRSNEIKVVEGVNELSFKPDEGEALRIKRIEVKGASADDFAEVYIGRTITGYFAVNEQGFDHLAPVIAGWAQENIFDTLEKAGKPLVYPVEDGETFTVKLGANADVIKATFDVYDAGDVSAEEPNGSKAKELIYIAYLTNANAFDTGDYYTLDKILNPVEFPDFPVVAVPSKSKIDVLAVLGVPLATSVGDGTVSLGTSYTTKFRIFYQRAVLFDPDRLGWLYLGDATVSTTGTTQVYDYTEVANEIPYINEYNRKMKFLEPILSFSAGEEVNFQVGASIDPDVAIEAGKLITALIQKITYE
jgi:hypothetical protein